PLGEDLKIRVLHVLSNPNFKEALKKGYGFRPGMEDFIPAFIQDLRRDRALTIDRFLAKSSKEYQTLGKVAIAKIITDCEDDNSIFQSDSWYKILYKLICGYPNLENFGMNKLSILTFNYDRSLEHFLFNQLLNDYGEKNQSVILSLLKKVPIIHLHGRIHMLPWEDSREGCSFASRGFIPNIFEIAEKMILPNDEIKVLNEVYQIIEKAECIYFLGFGHDEINLRKLNISLISKCNKVFSTSYNLPLVQQRMVNNIFGDEIIRFSSVKVYDFLMNEFDPFRN
ncbi:MAG: hypothetical protein PHG68_03005, partial [Candidatus Omnitrophica bacterium]|nr:hypothetical protein [Candidatus Omnitrophota bacterium]